MTHRRGDNVNHIPTAQQPQGATNTAGSVFVGGSNHSNPHKATQGENRYVFRLAPGLVWSTLAGRMDIDMDMDTKRCDLTEMPVVQCPCEHCWPEDAS